jgi:hypothetical protein
MSHAVNGSAGYSFVAAMAADLATVVALVLLLAGTALCQPADVVVTSVDWGVVQVRRRALLATICRARRVARKCRTHAANPLRQFTRSSFCR